jgi:beta-glucanase (GH16 family)
MFQFTKRILIFSLFILTFWSCSNFEADKTISGDNEVAASAVPAGYNLVWADEFNGSGQPSSANWNYEVGNGYNPGLPGFQGWGNGEWEWYRPNHCYQSGGNLVIKAEWPSQSAPQYVVGGRNWYQVSGKLTTRGKKAWQYGYFEARIKLPTGQGNWCALWFMGSSSRGDTWTSSYNPASGYYDTMVTDWASCGEIDWMEHANANASGDGGVFWDLRNGVYPWTSGQNGGYWTFGSYGNLSQYHIFSMLWTASAITCYCDGRQYFTVNTTPSTMEEFRKPFYMILNQAIGGTVPGNPNFSAYPQYMYVDYIRVYQHP